MPSHPAERCWPSPTPVFTTCQWYWPSLAFAQSRRCVSGRASLSSPPPETYILVPITHEACPDLGLGGFPVTLTSTHRSDQVSNTCASLSCTRPTSRSNTSPPWMTRKRSSTAFATCPLRGAGAPCHFVSATFSTFPPRLPITPPAGPAPWHCLHVPSAPSNAHKSFNTFAKLSPPTTHPPNTYTSPPISVAVCWNRAQGAEIGEGCEVCILLKIVAPFTAAALLTATPTSCIISSSMITTFRRSSSRAVFCRRSESAFGDEAFTEGLEEEFEPSPTTVVKSIHSICCFIFPLQSFPDSTGPGSSVKSRHRVVMKSPRSLELFLFLPSPRSPPKNPSNPFIPRFASPPNTYTASLGATSEAAPDTATACSPFSSIAFRVVQTRVFISSTNKVSPVSFFPSFDPYATHIRRPSTSHTQWWYRSVGRVTPLHCNTRQISMFVIPSKCS